MFVSENSGAQSYFLRNLIQDNDAMGAIQLVSSG